MYANTFPAFLNEFRQHLFLNVLVIYIHKLAYNLHYTGKHTHTHAHTHTHTHTHKQSKLSLAVSTALSLVIRVIRVIRVIPSYRPTPHHRVYRFPPPHVKPTFPVAASLSTPRNLSPSSRVLFCPFHVANTRIARGGMYLHIESSNYASVGNDPCVVSRVSNDPCVVSRVSNDPCVVSRVSNDPCVVLSSPTHTS